MRLTKDLDEGKHKVFFDNYFASPELHVRLREKRIYSVSTLRANRSRHCPFKSEKDLKKDGRGTIQQITDSDNDIVVCSWFDNKRVLTMSNFIGKDPVDGCTRYDRSKKEKVQIQRPAIVQLYNKFMGA